MKSLLKPLKTRSSTAVVVLSFIVVLLFQNCSIKSPLQFSTASLSLKNSESSQDATPGGNGGGYEGKPEGIYERIIPGFECEGQPAAFSKIELKNDSVTLTINTKEKCDATKINLNPSDIQGDQNYNDIVSIKDGLYQKRQNNLNTTKMTEVLCYEIGSNPNYSLRVTKESPSEYQIEIRDLIQNQSTTVDSVNKSAFMQKIKYLKGDVSLEIDATKVSRADLALGKFASRLKWPTTMNKNINAADSSVLNLKTNDIQMTCQLALNFDGVIWPSARLTTTPFTSFLLTPTEDSIIVGHTNGEVIQYPIGQLTGIPLVKLPEFQSASTLKYKQSSLLIMTESSVDGHSDLYSLGSNRQLVQLNKSGTTVYDFEQDLETQKVIFLEGQMPAAFQAHEADYRFRTNSLDGKSYQQLHVSDLDFMRSIQQIFGNPDSLSSYGLSPRWLEQLLRHKNQSIYILDTNPTNVSDKYAHSLFLRSMLSADQKNIFMPNLNFNLNKSNYQYPTSLAMASATPLSAIQEAHKYTQLSGAYFASNRWTNINYQTNKFESLYEVLHLQTGLKWSVNNLKKIQISKDGRWLLYQYQPSSSSADVFLELSNLDHSLVYRFDNIEGLMNESNPFDFINDQTFYFTTSASNNSQELIFHQGKVLSAPQGGGLSIALMTKSICPFRPTTRRIQFAESTQFFVFVDDRNHDGINEIYAYYYNLDQTKPDHTTEAIATQDDSSTENPFGLFNGLFQINGRYSEYGSVENFKIHGSQVIFTTQNNNFERFLFLWNLQ